MENNQTKNIKKQKILTGVVVSDKCLKTITVKVDVFKMHPVYHKRVLVSKKFLVHDEKKQAKLGDLVEIIETRPLSKRKHFNLLKVKQQFLSKSINSNLSEK